MQTTSLAIHHYIQGPTLLSNVMKYFICFHVRIFIYLLWVFQNRLYDRWYEKSGCDH